MPAGFTSAMLSLGRLAARRMLEDHRGVTAVEYAIIAGIMVLAVFGSVPAIGTKLVVMFNAVSAGL